MARHTLHLPLRVINKSLQNGSQSTEAQMQALGGSGPAWISLCVLFLSVLVVSASADELVEEGTEVDQATNNTGEEPGTLPTTQEPCHVSYIVDEDEVPVAKKCKCKPGEKEDDEEYYYDYYEDDDYNDEFEVVVMAESGEKEATPTLGSGEADKELSYSPGNNTTDSTASTTQAHRDGGRGRLRTDAVVPDGTPCALRREDHGWRLTAGVCWEGKCNSTNTTSHKVKPTKRPAYDYYYYHCRVNTTSINSKLEVAVGCVASCYVWRNRTWNTTNLDDGRLCRLGTEERNGLFINRTGVCRNGSCVTADLTPWTHPDGCLESTTKRNGKILAVRCTDHCKNGTTQTLPDGTPCLLDYERRVKVPFHVPNHIVEGVCKHGECIIIPPTVPVLTVNVPEEGCNHFLSPVRYMERVDSSCSMLCSNQQFKQVKEDTLCARETTGKWPVVTNVGQCVAGACREKAPDTPPVHEKVNANFANCRMSNELTVIRDKLIVVLSCRVECAYGNFENREDGVKCLLQYGAFRTPIGSNRKHGMYTVGVCKGGYCTLGKNPQNVTTED